MEKQGSVEEDGRKGKEDNQGAERMGGEQTGEKRTGEKELKEDNKREEDKSDDEVIMTEKAREPVGFMCLCTVIS